MRILKSRAILITACIMLFFNMSYTQEDWYFSIDGALSKPTGNLNNWFKYGQNYTLGIGTRNQKDWYVKGILEYSRYTEDNLSGYPAGKLDLYLEHIALWVNGKYPFLKQGRFEPFISIAGGPVRWKGVRGEIKEDEERSIPNISKEVLSEWDMGARAGIGFFVNFNSIKLNIETNYRLIVGNLYPTMQEYIELDGVNGFQSFNIKAGLSYSF